MGPCPARALAVLLPAIWTTPVLAASLSVAPTRVELGPAERSAVVTLRNDSNEPVMVQVQTFAWPRTPATADLEPTRELIAVPPVFALAANGKQIIRVALRGAPPSAREAAYRLLLTEVPAAGRAATGVRFALRLSLPVFVTPPDAAPRPVWAVPAEGGRPVLRLANEGVAHIQVKRIQLRAPGRAEPVQTIDAAVYLLPGQEQVWPLSDLARAQSTLQLEAETNLGPIEASLVLPHG
jgi:fimbrial chaperone protein